MSNVIQVSFRGREALDADRNLAEFIRFARDELTWLSDEPGFNWDAAEWPTMRWSKIHVAQRREFSSDEALDAEFIEFAKAYYRWHNSERPSKSKFERQALKCLEAALLSVTGRASVVHASWNVLEQAAQQARNRFSEGVQYQVGRHLEAIARFLTENHISRTDLRSWKSGLERPTSVRQVGTKADEESLEKLPSEAGMRAVADLFAMNSSDTPTAMVAAIWALLLCAPWRISEVLRLHVNAECEQRDGRGDMRYGLRYYGSKGFENDVKWIPRVMESLAREAFARIRKLTKSARDLALHLERQPEIPFVYHDAPEVGHDDELSPKQKAAFLRRKLPKRGWHRQTYWKFRSIREHWEDRRTRLPLNFPVYDHETGLRWSEALFSMHAHFLHASVPTDWYQLGPITPNTVNDLLGHRDGKVGVLWKHGFTEDDGTPIKLTTHMPRHLLGTLSERGAMSEEDKARWAARAHAGDNIFYDHRSSRERAEKARIDILSMAPCPGRQDVQIQAPVRKSDAPLHDGQLTHRTLWGRCGRDLAMQPCDKFVQCLHCTEHLYTKGDEEQERRIKDDHQHALDEFHKIIAAKRAGLVVAEQSIEHVAKLLVRTSELVELIDDDNIAEGTVIRLTDEGAETSHLKRVLSDRLANNPPSVFLVRVQKLLEEIPDG